MSRYPEKLLDPHLLKGLSYRGGKQNPDRSRVVKLSSNENPLGASPLAIQAIRDHLHLLHEYPDNGDDRLREALQCYYQSQLDADQFLTAPSGSELIEMIIRGFVKSGNEVIVCSPTFLPYQVFAEKQGAVVVDVPSKRPDFAIDVEALLQAISVDTRIIFLASPNNPTGSIISKTLLQEIIQALPPHVVLVLDEVYHLYADDRHYGTAVPHVQAGKNVIGLNSFSKSHGLAGLRLGYAYTTHQLANYLRLLYKPFLLNILQIEAGIAALSDVDFIQESINLVLRERSLLAARFEDFSVRYWPSHGNFIMFQVPEGIMQFEEKMLEQQVMIRPVKDHRCPNCFRVSIGRPEDMRSFTRALKQVLEFDLHGSVLI